METVARKVEIGVSVGARDRPFGAVIVWHRKDYPVEVGAADNPCPACGRKSLRVYAPSIRVLTVTRGFHPYSFLAKCRRPDCSFEIGDYRELHPDGGFYGPAPPPEVDLLYFVAILARRDGHNSPARISIQGGPVRKGNYSDDRIVVVREPASVDDPEKGAEALAQLAAEATAAGKMLLVAPSVIRPWLPAPPEVARPVLDSRPLKD